MGTADQEHMLDAGRPIFAWLQGAFGRIRYLCTICRTSWVRKTPQSAGTGTHARTHTHTHVQHWHGWVSLCEETLDLSDQPDAELDDRLWGSPDPRFGKAVQAQGWQVFIHGRTPSCARQ